MIAEHLLQVYFMQGQEALLVTFCDALDIPHNGKGQVEGDIPETLDNDKLKVAIDALLEGNDPALVTLYLRTFNLQTPEGWSAMTDALDSDERLKLSWSPIASAGQTSECINKPLFFNDFEFLPLDL